LQPRDRDGSGRVGPLGVLGELAAETYPVGPGWPWRKISGIHRSKMLALYHKVTLAAEGCTRVDFRGLRATWRLAHPISPADWSASAGPLLLTDWPGDGDINRCLIRNTGGALAENDLPTTESASGGKFQISPFFVGITEVPKFVFVSAAPGLKCTLPTFSRVTLRNSEL